MNAVSKLGTRDEHLDICVPQRAARFLLAVLVACAGCGDSTPVGYVTGRIVHNGSPVAAGNKVFFEQSGKGYLATGVVAEDGTYSLNYKGSSEIPLGDYVVFVGPPTSSLSEQEFYALKKKVDAEFRGRGENPPPSPDWVLPVKFYQASTSPLRKTVTAGENVIALSLDP